MLLLTVLQGPSSYTFIHFLEGIAVHNLHDILDDVFSFTWSSWISSRHFLFCSSLPPWMDGHMRQPVADLGGSQAIGHQPHSTCCDGCHMSPVYGPCHPKIECKATPGTWCMSSLQCNPPVGCIDFAIVEPRTQIHALRTRLAPSCWNHLWGKSCTGDFRAPPWWQPGWVCRRRSMCVASMEAAALSFPQQGYKQPWHGHLFASLCTKHIWGSHRMLPSGVQERLPCLRGAHWGICPQECTISLPRNQSGSNLVVRFLQSRRCWVWPESTLSCGTPSRTCPPAHWVLWVLHLWFSSISYTHHGIWWAHGEVEMTKCSRGSRAGAHSMTRCCSPDS